MTTNNNVLNTTTTAQEDIYTTAEKAVYIALKARHEKSGLNFLHELQNAQHTDRTARRGQEYAEQINIAEEELEELRQELAELQADKNTADRNAVNLKNSAELRKAWAVTSQQLEHPIKDHKNRITRLITHISALYEKLATTYTDRADLTQTAVLQILENEKNPAPITSTVLAVYGVDTAEELTESERADAQQRANFRAVINAVGRAVSDIATPEALNRTTTKVQQATAEEVADFIATYGGIGSEYKAPYTTKRARASDCYITIEERHTKTQNGYYKVFHYKTVAPYQYIESYTEDENGESDAQYLKTYNPFVSNSADLDRLEELYTNANLTDRQRQFLQEFAKRCRYEQDFKACKDYAFSKIGITTESNKTTFFNRLKKALTK